jgi:RNA polymerase sigma factor (sigma-70 family)
MKHRERFNDGLIENVYLHCYKLLCNKDDAEDLAQDILEHAYTAVYRGKEIGSFYPWFWRLAHNRYCAYLSKRNKTPYTHSVEGGQIAATLETGGHVEDDLIMREEISALNFAVSRLSREHREMVIMFYLKEMKIKDIVDALKTPVGTVKRRLFDTKSNLRKGLGKMNNTAITGKSAYAPASLTRWHGYSAGRHQGKLDNLILDQIFIACRFNAKTVNEIADEIGVAPVYLEKIMEYHFEHKFLKRDAKGRILTDFCVIPRQPHHDANYEIGEIYAQFGAEITAIIEAKRDSISAMGFYGNDFDFRYLLWILYVFACDRFHVMALAANEARWAGRVAKDNGKDYRIAGTFTMPDEVIEKRNVKSVSWSNLHDSFENSDYGRVCYVNFFQHKPFANRDRMINASNAPLLFKLIETGGEHSLNETETEQAAFFISKGVIVKDGGKLKVNIPVMTFETDDKIRMLFTDLLEPLVEKYVDAVNAVCDKFILPHIRGDLMEEYAHWMLGGYFFPIMYVFWWAMKEGNTLAIPEDYAKSAAVLYLKYKK